MAKRPWRIGFEFGIVEPGRSAGAASSPVRIVCAVGVSHGALLWFGSIPLNVGNRMRVGLAGDGFARRYTYLFEALASLYPIEFCPFFGQEYCGLDALLFLNGDVGTGLAAAAAGLLSFVIAGEPNSRRQGVSGEVHFGDSDGLERCIRGRVMREDSGELPQGMETESEDEVLARKAGIPVWVKRRRGKGSCQITGIAPPVLGKGQYLFQHLNSKSFMGLLPLMSFLGGVVKAVDWRGPAPRACFVFDDPSLYWSSYGFLNFQQLAEHAVRHDYCVSVAMIPIDTWWVKESVAELIRNYSPRLSLAIHGNNHTWCELLPGGNGDGLLAPCAQALVRIERLCKRHNLAIPRIMEPPHGAIASQAFQELLALGYDATLCTTEHLVRYNSHVSWPAAVGMGRTEVLGGGMPVLPRIRMSADWKNDVILAAFLRQPIIVAGHHQDAADGLGLLEEMAKLIKSFGNVEWSDLEGTLRTNHLEKVQGELHSVKMYARKVRVTIPAGVQRLRIERPWVPEGVPEPLTVRARGEVKRFPRAGNSICFEQRSGATVELFSERISTLNFAEVKPRLMSLWPVSRKIMMEMRDRLLPIARELPKLNPMGWRTNPGRTRG